MPEITDLNLPDEAMNDLAGYLQEKFRMVLAARSNQIDEKATRWQKNYDGIPAQLTRTTPFLRASNFMPHLIRMHSDILAARLLGFIFSTKPFWIVRSLLRDSVQHEVLESLSEGLNYLWDVELYGFEMVDEVVNHSLQTGTLILKGLWTDESRSYHKDGKFEEVETNELHYDPVPFENFWPYPITAASTRRTEVLFERIRHTERAVRERVKSGRWYEQAGLLVNPDGRITPSEDARARSTGINLTKDVDYPYSSIECWLDYELAGKKRPIVVAMNPLVQGKDSILRCYHNFMPYGETPFVDFKPMPRRGSFFGYSVPEILEQSQEEQAQIHNFRRDANVIANTPTWKKKRYADVPNPATDWYPGAIIELDEMDDLEMLNAQTNYNSLIDEEQFLMSLAERDVGISPSMQGFGAGQAAGKRGVYSTGATLALLSEGNRRLDIYMRRLRYPFHRVGRLTVQSYNQFAPNFWKKFGEKGDRIREAFGLVDTQGKLLFDPAASEASANREIDRQNLLQMANVMGTYYERIIQAATMVGQIPADNPLREVILLVLDGAKDLAARLLFAFDQGDRARILPDVRRTLQQGPAGGPAAQPGAMPNPQGNVSPAQLEALYQSVAAAAK